MNYIYSINETLEQRSFMHYLIFWLFGFGLLWAGLKLFDDEIIFISTAIVGSGLVIAGLISAPLGLQLGIEAALVFALFNVCMECIKRGDRF